MGKKETDELIEEAYSILEEYEEKWKEEELDPGEFRKNFVEDIQEPFEKMRENKKTKKARDLVHDFSKDISAIRANLFSMEEENVDPIKEAKELDSPIEFYLNRGKNKLERYKGEVSFEPEERELIPFIKEIADEHARLDVETDLEELPEKAEVDSHHFNVMLGNLLDNAERSVYKKAQETGNYEDLNVEIRGKTEEGNIVLEVEDNGLGVPEEIDPFEKGETSREEGMGRGGHMIKRAVEVHDGGISYENLEEGARFTVKLPYQEDQEEEVEV